MANIDGPRGMEPINSPYGSIKRTKYRVNPSCASILYIGDPVDMINTGTVTIATAGAGNPVLGCIVDIFDSTGKPVKACPATSTGYTVTVADDPNQEFIMQEDGAVSDRALADIGINVDLIAGTGSVTTGLSAWEIDSSSIAASANVQLRIIDKADILGNALGDWCRWVVKINNHRKNAGIVGVGV